VKWGLTDKYENEAAGSKNQDGPLCPPATNAGAVSRKLVARWDREKAVPVFAQGSHEAFH